MKNIDNLVYDMLIEKFSQRGTHKLLILLLDKDLKTTDITAIIHPQTAYRAINVLKELGLINVERREFNTRYHFLTDKGKKVALKLKEIEELLQEEQ